MILKIDIVEKSYVTPLKRKACTKAQNKIFAALRIFCAFAVSISNFLALLISNLAFAQYYLVFPVRLYKLHLNDFSIRRRDVFANIVGLYRQLSVPPIDQYRKLYPAGPAEIYQRVERAPDGPARI
jgi:hypothetical protein